MLLAFSMTTYDFYCESPLVMWRPLSGRRRHRTRSRGAKPKLTTFEHRVPLHHVHPRAAATMEEFTEGRLECTVDSPQKENAGTKDVYISYLITTSVWRIVREPGSNALSSLNKTNSPSL